MNTPYKLDTMIKVDESLCINCGSCIRAYPGGLITKADFPVPIENGWDLCIDCGHCVAICPTEAMHQRSMGPEDCEEIDIHLIPKWDRVRQFLISRRSVRGHIRKPIEKEKVLQLLDVARCGDSRRLHALWNFCDGLSSREIPTGSGTKASRCHLALRTSAPDDRLINLSPLAQFNSNGKQIL